MFSSLSNAKPNDVVRRWGLARVQLRGLCCQVRGRLLDLRVALLQFLDRAGRLPL